MNEQVSRQPRRESPSLFDSLEQASYEMERYLLDERELEDLRYLHSREFYRLHNVNP